MSGKRSIFEEVGQAQATRPAAHPGLDRLPEGEQLSLPGARRGATF